MTGPEDEFSKFLDDIEGRQAADAELTAVVTRLSDFLETRGIDVESPIVQIEVRTVAALKLMLEEVELLNSGHPSISMYKKKAQARYIIRDFDPVWQDLIDQELVGESLQDSDIEIIASEFSEGLEQSEEVQIRNQETRLAMFDHLVEESKDAPRKPFSEEDHETIETLVFFHNIDRLKPQDRFEYARAYLMDDAYLDDPAWNSLLEKFFPTSE